MTLQIRLMQTADLGAVLALQAALYDPGMLEDLEFYANRLALSGDSCWVADSPGQGVCGYLVSYPWDDGLPPALNASLAALPAGAQNWFLHDCAVAASMSGQGVAGRLVQHGLQWARARMLTRASLVSLGHAQAYWLRHGFAPMPQVDAGVVQQKLAAYGAGACWMSRHLAASDCLEIRDS